MLRYALAVLLLSLLAVAALVTGRGLRAASTPAGSPVTANSRPPGAPPPVLWSVPDFDLADHRGGRTSRASLAGKVWIASFLYTGCTTVCPTLAARLVLFERKMPAADLRFVSVSVDPAHDRPEVLPEYLLRWRPDERWILLAPAAAELEALARGMRVAVVPGSDPKNPIVHSSLLSLVDAAGRVRGIYDSDDEAAWKQLAADATLLLGAAPPAPPPASEGSLLVSLGCLGCHDRPEVAPSLRGLAAHPVKLATGETVFAEPGYLRESILQPAAKVVAGYAPRMPSYQGQLGPGQLEALLLELLTLPAGPPPPPGMAASAGGTAEDPICHMKVATVDPDLAVTEGGSTYHFCSRMCKEAFLAEHRQGTAKATSR